MSDIKRIMKLGCIEKINIKYLTKNNIIISTISHNKLLKYINEKEDEIERLNNIINELEKEFDKELESLGYREEKLYTQGIHDTIITHKYKLQELKGSDKE